MAREVMVPRTDAFMVDIQDDSQTIIQSILKQNFSHHQFMMGIKTM